MPGDPGVRKVEIVGLRDFQRELKRIGPEFAKELKDANLEAAYRVSQEAKRRAPRGPHQGGKRVAPIWTQIRPGATARGGFVQTGNAAAPHAVVYEFGGTIPRRGHSKKLIRAIRQRHGSFEKAGLSVTRVRAQPYLYPALAAMRDEVTEFYGEAIDRVSRRAFPSGGFLR